MEPDPDSLDAPRVVNVMLLLDELRDIGVIGELIEADLWEIGNRRCNDRHCLRLAGASAEGMHGQYAGQRQNDHRGGTTGHQPGAWETGSRRGGLRHIRWRRGWRQNRIWR